MEGLQAGRIESGYDGISEFNESGEVGNRVQRDLINEASQ